MPKASSRRNHLHRGALLHRNGSASAAAREYQQHLAAYPSDKLGHYHLALALEECGNADAAASSYGKALELDPYYPEALNNLGILFHRQRKLDTARLFFARALAARPDYSDAEYNYATVESDAGNHQSALLHFSRVLERNPKRADAWNNLGKVFLSLREPTEAKRACQIALALDPGLRSAAWNHSVASLTLGQLPHGWTGFEYRGEPRHTAIPRWTGEPLNGKRLLIHAEQGMGDTIQFFRYCSQVQDGYILECHPELLSLLPDTNKCIPFGSKLPEIDLQIPLMSLPELFQTSLVTIPANVPYLKADAKLVREWNRRMVSPVHSKRIGIVWAGNPKHGNDLNRSIDPGFLKPLAAMDDQTSFYCLQQQPQSAAAYSHAIPFAGIFDRLTWADTAAIVMNLDLVISVDTAVAHLAGALGRPVWTLLPYAPDWRWMLDRTDTPWYPTMRLFRQPRPNDWQSVIAEVSSELHSLHSDRSSHGRLPRVS